MAKSIEQRLQDVEDAIDAVLSGEMRGGQSVQIRGRMIERPSYRQLRQEERRLRRVLARKESGGVRTRQGVPLDG